MAVLETLIQYRATVAYPQAVAALNSITTVFASSPKVRDSFVRFMSAANDKPFDQGRLVERYVAIINAVVQDLGLDGKIAASDIDSFYYPELLGRAHAVETAEVLQRSEVYQPTANNDPRTAG
jgi:hypothetical protein